MRRSLERLRRSLHNMANKTRARAHSAFLERLHPKTGFIHREGMISVRDNLLFALNLFQQKTKEDALAGTAILRRLFAYRKEGVLPSYLHTLGEKTEPAVLLRMLSVLIRLEPYSRLMEPAVRSELICITEQLKAAAEQFQDEELSFLSRARREACLSGAINWSDFTASSSAARADLAESIALAAPERLPELFTLYHPKLAHFCPPGYFESFMCGRISPTVVDALLDPKYVGEHLLETPLFPDEMELPTFEPALFEGEKNGLAWRAELGESAALTWVNKGDEMVTYHANSFYPMLFFWRGEEGTHSLAMNQPKGSLVFSSTDEGCLAEMVFSGEYAAESRETRTLMTLFIDDHPGLQFSTGGKRATLFKPGEQIDISCDGLQLHVRVESDAPLSLVEGIGIRPSEAGHPEHQRGPDRTLSLEALGDLNEAQVRLYCSGLNEALSSATPMACMPLST